MLSQMKIYFAKVCLRTARIHWLIPGKGYRATDAYLIFQIFISLSFLFFQLAAITKLRVKGQILTKTDPNSIKKLKEPQDVLAVKERVEKNNTFSPQGTANGKLSSRKETLLIKEMVQNITSLPDIKRHYFISIYLYGEYLSRISAVGTDCFLQSR